MGIQGSRSSNGHGLTVCIVLIRLARWGTQGRCWATAAAAAVLLSTTLCSPVLIAPAD